MHKVKIIEIADELGIKPKEVLQKAIMMSIDVKSIRSIVSVEDASKIFDTIIYGKKINPKHHEINLFYKNKNLNIFISEQETDISFLKKISQESIIESIDNSLVFSYNYNDEILQKIYATSDKKIDIEKYLIEVLSEDTELTESSKKISNTFDIEYVNDIDPLNNIKYYISKFKPQLISIEGINFNDIITNNEILKTIKKLSIFGTKFNLSIVNMDQDKAEKLKKFLNVLH